MDRSTAGTLETVQVVGQQEQEAESLRERIVNLYDVLHKLIELETQKGITYISTGDNRTKLKRSADLRNMRRLSKRDAFYRVIRILRGYDLEFQCEEVSDATLDIFTFDANYSSPGQHQREANSV